MTASTGGPRRRMGLRACVLAAACAVTLCAPTGAATVPRPAAGQAALAVSVTVRNGAVALVGANGTGVQVLAVGAGRGHQLLNPSWSPDGGKLAYTSTQAGSHGHAASSVVFIARLPGNRPRALTAQRPGRLDDDAAFSPLGTRVAFVRGSTARHSASQIMVVPATFGPPTALTSGRSGGHTADDSAPAWSPSADRIAFTRTIGASSSIWVMSTNGAVQHQLIADAQQPAWSPDGRHLAFVSTRDRHGRCGARLCAELYVAGADGSSPKRLTTTALDESDPAWSPDGSRIAYARGGGRDQIPSSVFTIDPTGTCPFQVTGTATVSAPAWRPRLAAPARPAGC